MNQSAKSPNSETGTVPDILVVAPWLQGGGAQGALAGILRQIPKERIRLVVLFDENRDFSTLTELAGDVVFLNRKRNPFGILSARSALKPYLKQARRLYSLMRASHLVIGAGAKKDLRNLRVAATFHQLPSHDSSSLQGRIENILIRRATLSADLVTTPSERAVGELVTFRLAKPSNVKFESNAISVSNAGAVPPRNGELRPLRLLLAGRLTDQKGIDRLQGLLEGISDPIELRIVGEGDMQGIVDSLCTRAPAPHEVEHFGYSREMVKHLDWCDAVLMPSRWELNPLLVWESWARARPVVASNISVFQDLSGRGPVLLFDEAEDLAAATQKLRRDSQLRNTLGAEANNAYLGFQNEKRYVADFLTS